MFPGALPLARTLVVVFSFYYHLPPFLLVSSSSPPSLCSSLFPLSFILRCSACSSFLLSFATFLWVPLSSLSLAFSGSMALEDWMTGSSGESWLVLSLGLELFRSVRPGALSGPRSTPWVSVGLQETLLFSSEDGKSSGGCSSIPMSLVSGVPPPCCCTCCDSGSPCLGRVRSNRRSSALSTSSTAWSPGVIFSLLQRFHP